MNIVIPKLNSVEFLILDAFCGNPSQVSRVRSFLYHAGANVGDLEFLVILLVMRMKGLIRFGKFRDNKKMYFIETDKGRRMRYECVKFYQRSETHHKMRSSW